MTPGPAPKGVDRVVGRKNSVSWFVFVLVGGSAITLVQLSTIGLRVPLSLAFQALLAFQAVLIFARRPFRVSTPGGVAPAVGVMLGGAFAVLLHAIVLGTPPDELRTSFLFMYGIGLVMIVFIAGPATVRLTTPLVALLIAAFVFGVVQMLSNDLLLPGNFKDHYGIAFERFVNGRVRVLAFFPSAPRFAEVVVFVLIYVIFSVIQGGRARKLRVIVAVIFMVLLYNTFSRSGYLFFISALFFLLIQGRARLSTRSDGKPAVTYYAMMTALVLGGLYLALSSAVSDLAVGDSTSLDARFSHWTALKEQFNASGSSAFFFGTGKSAHANFLESDYFVIDNVFYAFGFFGGLIGLSTVLWLYWRTLRTLLRARSLHPEVIPLVALLSALPVEGLFVDNHNTLLLVVFISIGVLNRYAHEDAPPTELSNERSVSRQDALQVNAVGRDPSSRYDPARA